MSTFTPAAVLLPELPLERWEKTKDTLHLWVQIVGKVRMASTPPRNHWWHVPLYVDVRGLTTQRMHSPGGVTFQVDFDFIDHRLVVRTRAGAVESFALADGLTVAAFDERLHSILQSLAIDVPIRETPFGVPVTTPFPEDRERASYDRGAIERYWQILDWTATVFESSPAGTAGRRARSICSGTRSTLPLPASAVGAPRRSPAPTRSRARPTRTR